MRRRSGSVGGLGGRPPRSTRPGLREGKGVITDIDRLRGKEASRTRT